MNTIHLIDNRSFWRKLLDNFSLWKHRTFHNHKGCKYEKELLQFANVSNCLESYTKFCHSLKADFFQNFDKYVCKNCRKRFSCSCNTNINPEEDYAPYWCFTCEQLTIFDTKQTDEDSWNSTCLRCKNTDHY